MKLCYSAQFIPLLDYENSIRDTSMSLNIIILVMLFYNYYTLNMIQNLFNKNYYVITYREINEIIKLTIESLLISAGIIRDPVRE